jgi:hypothetical protein
MLKNRSLYSFPNINITIDATFTTMHKPEDYDISNGIEVKI